MIVLPAIPAIVATVTPIVEAILVAAGIGALFGGATGAVGEVVTGVQEHGSINRAVVESAVHGAAQGAAEGALVGGAFGVVGVAVAPIVPVVGGALQPVIGVIDDVAKPAVDVVGKAVRPVLGAVDDIAGQNLTRAGNAVSSAAKGVGGTLAVPYRTVTAALNARNFRTLPRAVCGGGCLYVMDDPAHALHKIGVTSNPVQRLAKVQRDVQSKLNYVGISPVDDVFKAESKIHRQFAMQNIPHPNHLKGKEWFNSLSPLDVVKVFSN